MHLAIDLRFYRPEPYGLAVHIKCLFHELIPLLADQTKFTKITLIFDKQVTRKQLEQTLDWWPQLKAPKFHIFFTEAKYYTVAEQTTFLQELQTLQADLVYFFSFNYPLLYSKPFVYQVLDLTIPKTKSKLNPRVWAMLLLLNLGLRKAKARLLLGQETARDAEHFTWLNFTKPEKRNYRSNTVIFNGVNPLYVAQTSSSVVKSQITQMPTTKQQVTKLKDLKTELGITKDYLLFVSVWRKYKNIETLVSAFERLQKEHNHSYQLVLAGKLDPEYPEVLERVEQSPEFERKNIIVRHDLSDEQLVLLQDGALAYVFPSLHEGFGLTLVEAARRGTPVLCSDIPVFRQMLSDKAAFFFDPHSAEDIQAKLNLFLKEDPKQLHDRLQSALTETKQYTWSIVANQILDVLLDGAKPVKPKVRPAQQSLA
jgi:glycosyltransferase involved in cell wall biosynthesis